MAKKQKDETTNVNATANRDIVQRLNFLYQASIYLQSVAPGPSNKGKAREDGRSVDAMNVDEPPQVNTESTSQTARKASQKARKRKVGAKKTTADLARSYVKCMRVVGQKTTVKIDPSLKRSLCSGCSSTLVPGSNASIRVKSSSSQGNILTYTCLHCGASKRIPAPPNGAIASPSQNSSATPNVALDMDTSATIESNVVPPVSLERPPQISNKKKPRRSRALPLFARPDAGHVTFRGNERLPLDEKTGFGVLLG
ncbi:Ribonuclease P protein component 4 [Psilocybe cubensis]|uniref:Ribonuclease P protein component 4 n=1 Tax=Psilocybe cubensis TaxID=181762 RepID=A0ACB8HCH5_PSICU|nr:Ribonuclease P protein component 4 [Psilocybe cubensis]KAH9484865.1 Ribonuclease P protein component 4 [Psilocybe cubensis]